MPNKQDEYYSSHQKLSFIGTEGQLQMQRSSVLVIGAGGLGCPCLQVLAGAGVGTVGVRGQTGADGRSSVEIRPRP